MRTLLAVILISATATLAHAEQIDNPDYLHWKQFKVGSMSKIVQVTRMGANEFKSEVITTLKEVTDEKAVISVQTVTYSMGNRISNPPMNREFPAKIEKVVPPGIEGAEKPRIEKGVETILVAGRKVVCQWLKTTSKTGGNTSVTKTWSSESIPGRLAKQEAKVTGTMNTTTVVTCTEFKAE